MGATSCVEFGGTLNPIQENMLGIGWTKVFQYWEDTHHPIKGITRTWINPFEWPIDWRGTSRQALEATLKDFPPPLRKGQDIIRWGKKGDDNFHIKEAYQGSHGISGHTYKTSLDQSLEVSTVA
jgi:hypothetical protein